jgi:hypothetical protein
MYVRLRRTAAGAAAFGNRRKSVLIAAIRVLNQAVRRLSVPGDAEDGASRIKLVAMSGDKFG